MSLPNDPLIVDTGASICITPHASDFKTDTYRSSSVQVKDLSGVTTATDEGMIQWSVTDESGVTMILEVPGIHLESATVCLLSPQVLIKSSTATVTMGSDGLSFNFPFGLTVRALINDQTNLPQISLSDALYI
jgi:hypothetical protein